MGRSVSLDGGGESLLIMPVGIVNYSMFKYVARFFDDHSRIADLD